MQKVLTLICAAGLLASGAHAQTRPSHQPAGKRPATVAAKPAAKPATKPTPASAAKSAAPASQPLAAQYVGAAAVPATRASLAAPARAAQPLFQVGSNAVNLGVGFGLGYGLGGATTSTPALSLSYMRGVAQVGPGIISAGGMVGYKSFGWESAGAKATWRNIYVGGRGAYHYNFGNPKLDTYAGLGLGLRVVSYSDNYDTQNTASASGAQAELSGFLGARYFFSDKLGAFSELGYDMSYLKVGLSARF